MEDKNIMERLVGRGLQSQNLPTFMLILAAPLQLKRN